MKRPLFRPIEFWLSSLTTLPDTSFFELMRSALGNIKTPFNKQKLLEDLSVFFSRPEIQETVAAFIDGDDRRIIAAIALLGEPVPGELESFFSGEYSCAELHSLLINLEERFIVYRFREDGAGHIALNPRLEAVLAPAAEDQSQLFSPLAAPDRKPPDEARETTALNGRLLASLFAFFLSGEVFFKTDGTGGFRKKMLDDGAKLFPGLDLEVLAGGLLELGVLIQDGERLRSNRKKLAAFRDLENAERYVYLAAGAAVFLQNRGQNRENYTSRSLLKTAAGLIHSLASFMEAGKLYPGPVLVKRAEILRRETASAGSSWIFSGEIPRTPLLIIAMEQAGLLVKSAGAYLLAEAAWKKPGKNETAGKEKESAAKPKIAFDSPFSFVLYPEIPFAGALDAALFSRIEETGTALRFSISRESAARAFNQGCTADHIWKLLERLSLGRADGALKLNLEDWEQRCHEVALFEGTVLCLSGTHAWLAENGPIAALVKQAIAPGIFLLHGDREKAAAALREAGVGIISEPSGEAAEDGADGENLSVFPALSPHNDSGESPSGEEHAPYAYDADKAEQIKEKFRAALAGMKVSPQEKEELLARIKRRMIISDSQLRDISIRYEKLEARALDFLGKTAIAKQALEQGSLIEVNWLLNGEKSKILGTPENLEKKGGETILVIKPADGHSGPVKIPLGKISLLRRIKQSIFGE